MMALSLAANDPETGLVMTSLAQDEPMLGTLLREEILAELTGARSEDTFGLPDENLVTRTQFLSIASLAISRELALGRIKADAIPEHVAFLMGSSFT